MRFTLGLTTFVVGSGGAPHTRTHATSNASLTKPREFGLRTWLRHVRAIILFSGCITRPKSRGRTRTPLGSSEAAAEHPSVAQCTRCCRPLTWPRRKGWTTSLERRPQLRGSRSELRKWPAWSNVPATANRFGGLSRVGVFG